MKTKICMIGPDPTVKGGIATVLEGYLKSELLDKHIIYFIASHKDGNKIEKLYLAAKGYSKFIYRCLFNKPDIVHIHSSFGASFYRKAIFISIAKVFSIPIINHIHGAEFDKFYTQATDIKKKLVKLVYLKCDSIIVLSKEWKTKLCVLVDEERISIIENYAIYPNEIKDINENENNILFLGEVGKRKGAFDIPEVVKQVSASIPNVKFIICGNGQVGDMKIIAREMGVENNIEFKGWIGKEEKIRLLKASKIYFLPSYNEGLPMSILEGMAYGLPIISTTVGGIPTVIEQGVNGYLAKPGDCKNFTNYILKILSNQGLAKNISLNNYKKIKESYSLEANINKLNEVYSKLHCQRDTKKVSIAGLLFDKLSIYDACTLISKAVDSSIHLKKMKVITVQAANVDSVVKAHRNDEMKRVTNKFDIVLADGMPIVWASKLIKNPLIERVCGPDFFINFNKIANIQKYKYFFLGSTEKTLGLIKERLNKEFPNIEVVGMYSPPFSDMKDAYINDVIFEKIHEARPHIVWVSFGCPKQERWIIDNKEHISALMICGIGAAFEFYAETIKRAPSWMQNSGLEWCYRFIQEPRRLGKRYFIEGPLFVKYFIRNRKSKDININ